MIADQPEQFGPLVLVEIVPAGNVPRQNAIGLVLDWRAIRGLLNVAAERLGIPIPVCTLPPPADCHQLVVALSESPAVERAMTFGCAQLIGQHRGLWDLLEARQLARADV